MRRYGDKDEWQFYCLPTLWYDSYNGKVPECMAVASSRVLTYDATHETGRIEARVKSIWLAIKLSKHRDSCQCLHSNQ